MKEQHLENVRHSLAHVLAAAVIKKWPDTKLGIGPVIENGFYYDFQFSEPISDADLKDLEKQMKKIIGAKLPFSGEELGAAELKKKYADQPFKLELINEYSKEDKALTNYKTGDIFEDLCKGGHVENTSEINPDAFKLTKLAGAYWRGGEKNPMLTRIYGVAFETKEELDAYITMLEEAEKRDHKKLGKELGLFVFSEAVGKGLPLFTPKGATIRRELERFIVDEEIKRGYLHVYTPDIANLALYKKSGHYPYYKDSMYAPIEIDKDHYMLRPMSCPHHFELYGAHPHSYKELPMRIAELAKLYRYEQSGELMGLQRVRTFCLADGHIISRKEQAEAVVNEALDLIEFIAEKFGLTAGTHYSYRLSLGDRGDEKKYFKDDESWEYAEDCLRNALQKRNAHFVEAPAEAAFYGPKIDIQMKNVNGKEDTAFTVQYDFVMPKRFNLTYTNENGEDEQPVVIHRSSIGAIERVMAFLIEHYAGNFPLWLSPVQARVIAVSEKFQEYGESVLEQLRTAGVRAELAESNETLGKRIRGAQLEKIPYILVVGEQEQKNNSVAVRHSKLGDLKEINLEELISRLVTEIKEKQ